MMSSSTRKQSARRRLDERVRRFADSLGSCPTPYWRLIHAVRAESRLLVPLPDRGWTDPQEHERILGACVAMARRAADWHGVPEQWRAPEASPLVQFRSLVSHLFDRYPVPHFMAPVWLHEQRAPWQEEMYLHLAAGKSIRQFGFPLLAPRRMSKPTARFFMQAPDDVWPIAAYRWAHVRALGGDDRLARMLMMTPALCAPTQQEDFWESVIRFLIANAQIAMGDISEIVQFVYQQRFQPAETVWGPGAGRQPLQPNLTLRGRTLRSLRRHMANWRTELLPSLPPLARATPGWKKTDIRPFRQIQDGWLWTIDELLSDRELRVEGGIMQHCVATYIHDCARRRTSIWSMRMQNGSRCQRQLTIEVLPVSKTIWQAKGKRNSPPGPIARQMLQRWAGQEGLQWR